jgi:hypothetical protein
MSHAPNPFSDPPNPYAPSQTPGGPPMQMPPPPGALQFAPCPNCGNTYASKIGFTWWGGALGPALFTHVKCFRCGNAYNGKTGKSNTTAITIYVAVSTILGIVIAIALAMAGAFS